jgi:hypothetical protein
MLNPHQKIDIKTIIITLAEYFINLILSYNIERKEKQDFLDKIKLKQLN